MRQIHTQGGYTLIELLLYVAIISSLLLSISYFFAGTTDARIKNQTIAEVDQQGTYVMDSITQTIRNATSITAPAAGSSGASLTLVVPTASLSPTVYSLNGSTLQIKEGTATAIPLTNSKLVVSNLTFTNLSRSGTNGIVRVSFALNRVNPNNYNVYDYSRTFTTSAEVRW